MEALPAANQASIPTRRLALGVSLLSGSLLALEILYVRLISILLYPVATYLVISLALLGLGASSGVISLLDTRTRTASLAAVGAFGFSLTTLVSIFAVWFAGQVPAFGILFPLLLSLPMFFGGVAVSTAFSTPEVRIQTLYFADLVGAGTATLLVLLGLHYTGAVQVALVIALAGLLSASVFARKAWRPYLLAPGVILGVLLALSPRLPYGITPISPKELKLMQGLGENVQWEYQGWSALARVDVLSLEGDTLTPGTEMEYKLVTHDGGAPSLLIRVDDAAERQFLIENTIFGVPYWISDRPSVLIIGLGGGPDVIAALAADAAQILGAEVSPEMVAIVGDHFAEFVDDPYEDPRVQIELTDGRHLLASSDQRFDLIQLTGVDTTVASLGGNPNLAENYLYTREAFTEYLDHLNEGGLLSVSFPNIDGLGLRLLALTNEALQAHSLSPLSDHVIVGEMTGYVHLLVRKSPFTDEQVQILQAGYARSPTSVYFPLYHRLFGTPGEEFIADSHLVFGPGIMSPEPYRSFSSALSRGELDEFLMNQPFTLDPPTDAWPFFFVLDKLGYRAVNLETLLLTLGLLLLFSVILMITPPALLRRRGLGIQRSWSWVVYFACLGLGFIFVEVVFIQKLSLIVGHPSYSLAITLAALLISSGLGSLLSDRISASPVDKAKISTVIVALAVGLTHLLLSQSGDVILRWPLIWRALVSGLIVAIPGVFMGVPFPSGLSGIRRVAPNFIPWSWGINATFTVIGTVLSLVLAMLGGFNIVLISAALLYLAASLAIRASGQLEASASDH